MTGIYPRTPVVFHFHLKNSQGARIAHHAEGMSCEPARVGHGRFAAARNG
jgi:hypothetical protein